MHLSAEKFPKLPLLPTRTSAPPTADADVINNHHDGTHRYSENEDDEHCNMGKGRHPVWSLQRLLVGLVIILCFLGGRKEVAEQQKEKRQESLNDQKDCLGLQILRNIGPAAGAGDGLVVASPSTGQGEQPDYYYTWTRDSAMSLSSLIPSLQQTSAGSCRSSKACDHSQSLIDIFSENLFREYIQSQAGIQSRHNPSGGLVDGGLNEPKFNVDGSPFTGSWGRPQRDGPALRAITTMIYSNSLLDRNSPVDRKYIEEWIYSPKQIISPGKVLKNDLEEISHGWWKESFDLWEEVNAHHLFTLLVSRRALLEGSSFASRLEDYGAANHYLGQAHKITESLSAFWDHKRGYWLSSLDHASYIQAPGAQHDVGIAAFPERDWLDCSLPLSIIHAGSQTLQGKYNISASPFRPSDPDVLATLHTYIKSFKDLYGINQMKPWTDGWALGRYKEDVYDGKSSSQGNPWFICTYSLAHTLSLAREELIEIGYIRVTSQDHDFWEDIMSSVASPLPGTRKESLSILDTCRSIWWKWQAFNRLPSKAVVAGETWTKKDKNFEKALHGLSIVADRFMQVGMRIRSENDGRMSEQFGRDDGKLKGARDLTWSYASLLHLIDSISSPKRSD